ncbi:NUMOD3 domain-containing DNA-binding protein [archaeon]|jgi:group I intron endonuclease|nr:NUMOD3 domain-containing DNA-binding protein [archaeon]MCK9439611.1 NUMOD3 domain-containing DNA-binding protein [Patescibacteria group bacterium]
MYIYKITNCINNKIYIGKRVVPDKNNTYMGSGKILLLAYNKYGIENFKKDIIEECDDRNKLNELERFWIKYYNSTNRDIGYNISSGGDGGHPFGVKLSEQHKLNIGKSLYGRKHDKDRCLNISKSLKGKHLSDIHKQNISVGLSNSEKYRLSREKLTGISLTDEHKLNISESVKGEKNPFFGKTHSDESKQKMKDSHTIKVPLNIQKEIYEMRNKNKMKLNDIKEKYGYSITKIYAILNGYKSNNI